jgi:CheY-like chemotaxis protein
MGPARVLVIEDNVDAAQTLQFLLRAMGFDVAVAFTGLAGVELALKWKPDIVISDIGLPGLTGFEVARQLRQNPGTAHAFLVAVSGYGTAADKEEAKQAGFNCYLVKPVDPEILGLLLSRPAQT